MEKLIAQNIDAVAQWYMFDTIVVMYHIIVKKFHLFNIVSISVEKPMS